MSYPTNKKNIILAGGSTGGPITPLLSIIRLWQKQDTRITPVIFDVKNSYGEAISKKDNIEFKKIYTGKLRRYWTIKNLLTPFLLIIGFFQSVYYLRKFHPRLVIGAGGFVQLPAMYAAWVMRIPRVIHQQDVMVTLSNKLCSPIANLITTTFEFSIRDFSQGTGLGPKYIQGTKVYWTGNPSLYEDLSINKDISLPKEIKLKSDLPVLLVMGGAKGASPLNQIIYSALPELTKVVQIIHITGPGKKTERNQDNYYAIELSNNMAALYQTADIILARAGINTLTELAEFSKPSIIVPMPNTHQELNAELLFRTQSSLVLDQKDLDAELIIKAIRKILFESDRQKLYADNMRKLFPKNATKNILSLIMKLLDKNKIGSQHKV